MSKRVKKVKVGIMPFDSFKKHTICIAKGEYKLRLNEPKIWFSSMKSLANILSEKNQELLRLIIDVQPQSVSELEPLTGRKANNLLRTLRTMESYGFVKLVEGKKGKKGKTPLLPEVVYNMANIEINFCNVAYN
ncbi:MAG: transcriptional regulator [Coxiella sp. DG_40]|nr:MAG: transcriptional regulator [Coxiella sp. DG_40]